MMHSTQLQSRSLDFEVFDNLARIDDRQCKDQVWGKDVRDLNNQARETARAAITMRLSHIWTITRGASSMRNRPLGETAEPQQFSYFPRLSTAGVVSACVRQRRDCARFALMCLVPEITNLTCPSIIMLNISRHIFTNHIRQINFEGVTTLKLHYIEEN